MASIEIAKANEACVLIICDEQGHIMDSNSTYNHLFIRSSDPKNPSKPISNIQEPLPNFFENLHEENLDGFKIMR